MNDDHLRETLRQGFENRPTLRLADAAKLLKMDEKTLRRLADRNMVPHRITGNGRSRLRREFTLSDLETFYLTATARPTGIMLARTPARARPRPAVASTEGLLARAERRRTAGQAKVPANLKRSADGK
ncbi:hypothetical protein ABIE85_007136 [Bradyrhizobium diazoefficiens]|uniref:hypothetical protein n=1 Tax=Bradyrhizobium diazoefficiens TaxID=1355477 RepID=UPI00272B2B69|nr:hypothetical protein [Bradyrhizobium diazoefficiens]WLA57489.1 hypothetical protein QIH81_01710 [Bradyrhizobium diazoefficiens]